MVFHDGAILLCGGTSNHQECLHLDHGTWKEHNTLNQERVDHSAVNTQTATFVFGGAKSRNTYEYLPKGSTTWLLGKTAIPGGFSQGCAIAVKSDQEIWLIGGHRTWKRFLSFNVNDHTFKELLSQLRMGRRLHECAFIPNTKKIMLTGGRGVEFSVLNSIEIIDSEDGSVIMASQMRYKRIGHGMGVITINEEDRLAVFGGYYRGTLPRDSVELYNHHSDKWEKTNIKMKEARSSFGFLSLKLSDVISNM